MSRRLALYCGIISLLYCLIRNVDPLDTGFYTDKINILDYLSVFGSLCMLFLLRIKDVDRKILMGFVLFIIAVVGSLYSVLFKDFEIYESFLARAVNILPLFAGYFLFMSLNTLETKKFSKLIYRNIMIFSGIMILFLLGYNLMGRPGITVHQELVTVTYHHIYHEEGFIFLSLLPFLFWVRKKGILLLGLTALLLSMLIWKITAFLIGLTAMLIIYYLFSVYYTSYRWKMLRVSGLLSVVFGMVVLIVIVQSFFQDSLPSGSVSAREFTYAIRIGEFLDSPLLGSFYTSKTAIEFGSQLVPTHSDILDIASNLGVFGLFIFAWINKPLFHVRNHSKVLRNNDVWIGGLYICFVSMSLMLLIESFFNPILNQSRLAFFYWFSLGGVIAYQNKLKRVNYG